VLTTVQHQLHTTQSAATWVLTAYLLSASVMTPILGRVGDMITQADIMALVRAMRGLVHDAGEVQSWPRFLDIHLAGLRAASVP
jgi:MFS family permease